MSDEGSSKTPIQFYLNGKRSVAELETVELSHPNFSKTYRFVRNHMDGITAKIETDEYVDFDYRPVVFEILGFKDDLDQKINISLGTLGEVLPVELKNLQRTDGFLIKPTIVYRTYASDNLDYILQGPVNLLATEFVAREMGTGITAQAENISTTRTGEIYDLTRFYMLRGFIQ